MKAVLFFSILVLFGTNVFAYEDYQSRLSHELYAKQEAAFQQGQAEGLQINFYLAAAMTARFGIAFTCTNHIEFDCNSDDGSIACERIGKSGQSRMNCLVGPTNRRILGLTNRQIRKATHGLLD